MTWADKWKKGAAAAVEQVAAAAERVGVVRPVPPPPNRDAARELERRKEINARGAAIRAETEAAFGRIFGGTRRAAWIPRRPNWTKRRGAA